jgi:hypothetical protein
MVLFETSNGAYLSFTTLQFCVHKYVGISYAPDTNELHEGDLVVVHVRPPPQMISPGTAGPEIKPVFGYVVSCQKFGLRQNEQVHPLVGMFSCLKTFNFVSLSFVCINISGKFYLAKHCCGPHV